MTQRQVDAAWKLYEAGMTAPEIASQIWEQMGYASKKTCVNSLYNAWWMSGYKTRSVYNKYLYTPCKGCGGHMDERTPGCRNCTVRHLKRKERGAPAVIQSRADLCPTCHRPGDENRGCGDCYERLKNRKKRLQRARRRDMMIT